MANGTLGDLNLMDVFTRVIPGVVFVAGLLPLVDLGGLDPSTSTVVELALGGTLAFVVGMVLQPVGRFLEYRVFPTFWLPVWLESLVADVRTGESTHFEADFWRACVDRFALPEEMDEEEYAQLYRLLLTHLETTPYSRTRRMQAIYQMCRALGAAFLLLAACYVLAVGLGWLGTGIRTVTPSLLLAGALVSVGLSAVFLRLTDRFKRFQFDYMVLEFYLDQVPGADRPVGDGGRPGRDE
jgi:hypothetical protein